MRTYEQCKPTSAYACTRADTCALSSHTRPRAVRGGAGAGSARRDPRSRGPRARRGGAARRRPLLRRPGRCARGQRSRPRPPSARTDMPLNPSRVFGASPLPRNSYWGRSEEQTAAAVSPWVKATIIIRRELSVVTLSLCTPHMCVNVMCKEVH